jgi:antitoxin component HigA of HigAB toxin-antitoxin module
MKSLTKTTRHDNADDTYLELVRELPLRPIRSRKEYAEAVVMLDRLALLDDQLDAGQRDYLETLELLIDAYDDAHAAVAPEGRTPLERLKYLMQHNRMSSSALGDLLGNRPLASMILRGKRGLSKAHIRKLAERFRVDAGYFL